MHFNWDLIALLIGITGGYVFTLHLDSISTLTIELLLICIWALTLLSKLSD